MAHAATGHIVTSTDLPQGVKDKFGDLAVLTGTALHDLWSEGMTAAIDSWYVAAGGIPSFVSTAADVGSLTIIGILTADGSEGIETFNLTGAAPIALPSGDSYTCIPRMYYEAPVTGHQPVGKITASIGGVTISVINIGEGQTLQAFDVIPAGCVGYLTEADRVSGLGDEIVVDLYTSATPATSWRLRHRWRGDASPSRRVWGLESDPKTGRELVAGTRIKQTVKRVAGGASQRMSGWFKYVRYAV